MPTPGAGARCNANALPPSGRSERVIAPRLRAYCGRRANPTPRSSPPSRRAGGCIADWVQPPATRRTLRGLRAPLRGRWTSAAARRDARRDRRLPQRRRCARRRLQHQRDRPRRASTARISATTLSRRTPGTGYMSEGAGPRACASRSASCGCIASRPTCSRRTRARSRCVRARGLRARRLFAPLRADRGPLARSRALAMLAEDWRARRRGDARVTHAGGAARRWRWRSPRLRRCATHRHGRAAEGRARASPLAAVRRSTRSACRARRRRPHRLPFESTEPLDFNIHYHDGQRRGRPVVRERLRTGSRRLCPPSSRQNYCLMWEAGPAGALIDYRIASCTPAPTRSRRRDGAVARRRAGVTGPGACSVGRARRSREHEPVDDLRRDFGGRLERARCP